MSLCAVIWVCEDQVLVLNMHGSCYYTVVVLNSVLVYCFFVCTDQLKLQYPDITFHEKSISAVLTSTIASVDLPDVGVSLQAAVVPEEATEVMVRPCLAGPFVLPAGYRAASPIYFIQQSNDEELQDLVDLVVSVQHYFSLKIQEDLSSMKFFLISTDDMVSNSSYSFEEITDNAGTFERESGRGEIVLKKLGFLVIATRAEKGKVNACDLY